MATVEERIEKLKKRQAELKAQEKKLLAQQSQKERKERTKRLIEIGATVESVLGRPITKDELPLLSNFLRQQEERGQFFSKALEHKQPQLDDMFMSAKDIK